MTIMLIKVLLLAYLHVRRELASVVLEYKKGSVFTKTSSFDFPSSVDEVKLLTSNGTVTVLVTLNQFTIVVPGSECVNIRFTPDRCLLYFRHNCVQFMMLVQ